MFKIQDGPNNNNNDNNHNINNHSMKLKVKVFTQAVLITRRCGLLYRYSFKGYDMDECSDEISL